MADLGQFFFFFFPFSLFLSLFLFFNFHFCFSGEGESRSFHTFLQVERQVYVFTKQMKAFVTFASTICLFLPCIYAAIRFMIGKYSHSVWYLPYKFK